MYSIKEPHIGSVVLFTVSRLNDAPGAYTSCKLAYYRNLYNTSLDNKLPPFVLRFVNPGRVRSDTH